MISKTSIYISMLYSAQISRIENLYSDTLDVFMVLICNVFCGSTTIVQMLRAYFKHTLYTLYACTTPNYITVYSYITHGHNKIVLFKYRFLQHLKPTKPYRHYLHTIITFFRLQLSHMRLRTS